MATVEFKTITFDFMKDYIEKNAPQDKAWFKTVAYQTKDGKPTTKYNHLNAKMQFCKKYMPAIIPQAKEKEPNKTECLKDW